MTDVCPFCMSPIAEERRVEITEAPVIYDSVVEDLAMDPVQALGPAPDLSIGIPGPQEDEKVTASEQQPSSQA